MLDVVSSGVSGFCSCAWLGGEDCSVGGGGPRRAQMRLQNTTVQTSAVLTRQETHNMWCNIKKNSKILSISRLTSAKGDQMFL